MLRIRSLGHCPVPRGGRPAARAGHGRRGRLPPGAGAPPHLHARGPRGRRPRAGRPGAGRCGARTDGPRWRRHLPRARPARRLPGRRRARRSRIGPPPRAPAGADRDRHAGRSGSPGRDQRAGVPRRLGGRRRGAPTEDRGHRGTDTAGGPRPPPHPPRCRPQRVVRARHVRAHRALRHRGPWGDLVAGGGGRRDHGPGRRGLRRPGGCRVRRRGYGAPRCRDRSPPATRRLPSAGERPLLRRLRQAGVAPEAGLDIAVRKPAWVRVPVRMGKGYRELGSAIHDLGLVTVCEEAGCPNIYECWADGTATFMINGERCTRPAVSARWTRATRSRCHPTSPSGSPQPLSAWDWVTRSSRAWPVTTWRTGGPAPWPATITAIRDRNPSTTVEVLISDCRGDAGALDTIFEARPDVLNHNIETVARLQRAVRPSAGYARSLAVLARAARAGLVTKSGLMVGLGEREDEVVATMADLRGVGVSIVTIGQYLRPSRDHLPVSRYWAPEEFDRLRQAGSELGRGPRRGVASHPVELPRPRGGRCGHRPDRLSRTGPHPDRGTHLMEPGRCGSRPFSGGIVIVRRGGSWRSSGCRPCSRSDPSLHTQRLIVDHSGAPAGRPGASPPQHHGRDERHREHADGERGEADGAQRDPLPRRARRQGRRTLGRRHHRRVLGHGDPRRIGGGDRRRRCRTRPRRTTAGPRRRRRGW